jgi:hypothetical protein
VFCRHAVPELRAQSPDWVYRPDGPVSVNDDLGHLGFQFGPAGQPPVATGMDIARCKDGVIVELYTFVSGSSQPSWRDGPERSAALAATRSPFETAGSASRALIAPAKASAIGCDARR